MDIDIISKIASKRDIRYNDIAGYMSSLPDIHPLNEFLSSFSALKTKIVHMNLGYDSSDLSMFSDDLLDVDDILNPLLTVSSAEINMFIKKHKMITDLKFTEKDDTYECSICLDADQNFKILKCGHIFHERCIDRWMMISRGVCPLCKTSIYEEAIMKWYIEKMRLYR